uniref:Uncharacterized protein n=1 Tax=Caenorhabditis tropicalis TaxID=1561998 RepID=A0A1I7U3D2_9PELO
MYDLVLLIQLFISIVVTIDLLIMCKKKKTNQAVSSNNVIPTPVAPIPTESHTASSPDRADRKISTTAATPANVPLPTSDTKQGSSVLNSKISPPNDKKKEEKEKKQEKSLNSAFNERVKEETSAGVSETV